MKIQKAHQEAQKMVSIIIGNALNLETEKVKKKFDLEG
jgi:hypothetical protein